MIDLKKLQHSLSDDRIVELVNGLGGADYLDKGDHFEFRTICHHENEDDGNHKLYYYKNTKLFVCYSCCGTFDIFGLFKRRYETLGKEYNFYNDVVRKIDAGDSFSVEEGFYKKYETDYDSYDLVPPVVKMPHINPNILNIYTFHPTSEWLSDGISERSMRYYNIKYSIKENKIVIPHYDKCGHLIGIRNRNLNEEDIELGKYMPAQIGNHIYSHPLAFNLYGLNFVGGNISRYKMAIVFEGEKSPLLYDTFFGHNNNIAVATCGSTFHRYQLGLLTEAGAERVIIAFDKEGENWREKEKYYNKLKRICEKLKQYCQIGFVWDSQKLLGLKDSPIDKGKEIFGQLLNNIIWP